MNMFILSLSLRKQLHNMVVKIIYSDAVFYTLIYVFH